MIEKVKNRGFTGGIRMTDEEMAEESLSSYRKEPKWAGKMFMKDENTCYKDGFLAGLKAGRSEWHKVADGELPKENHFVLVLNKRTGYEIARHAPFEEYYLDNWVTIDNRSLVQTKTNPSVIAWCEIPKYTEE